MVRPFPSSSRRMSSRVDLQPWRGSASGRRWERPGQKSESLLPATSAEGISGLETTVRHPKATAKSPVANAARVPGPGRHRRSSPIRSSRSPATLARSPKDSTVYRIACRSQRWSSVRSCSFGLDARSISNGLAVPELTPNPRQQPPGGRRDREQLAGPIEIRLKGSATQQAVVTDAMEAGARQVEQERRMNSSAASVMTCCRSAPWRR